MKKILFTCVILILIIYSFFFPEITVNAARNGIQIWFQQILPALLPFTILSSVLVKSDFLKSFKGNANLIAIILTMTCGFIFGFPIGAKLSSDFYKQNLLSKRQATVLAIATNNFSPMYVCGFAMPLLFSSTQYNISTYVLLYLMPLVIVAVYLIWNYRLEPPHTNVCMKKIYHENASSSFHLDMQVIDAGIISGFESLIKICGYIVLFSIITQITTAMITSLIVNPPILVTILLGNLEITNGINLLSNGNILENLRYILTIQALSFGGASGIAQTASILSNSGVSIHKYIIGKVALSLLLTLLSVIYVFFIRSL
ncbi:MAG: hypothetical protein IJE49_09565 [Agathobacter sp.]|nr:hypothetical protein [Agathobacter sp.]